jgi:hypothetical protein
MWPVLLIIVFTVLSGYGDAQGFIHAGKVWQDGQFVWPEAVKSALGFQFGVVTFWVALRYLARYGVVSTEIQTLLWFGVTIIGVAVLSGKFIQWAWVDQLVGVSVLAGVGWLLFRTGG